jgi:hypothetical protein
MLGLASQSDDQGSDDDGEYDDGCNGERGRKHALLPHLRFLVCLRLFALPLQINMLQPREPAFGSRGLGLLDCAGSGSGLFQKMGFSISRVATEHLADGCQGFLTRLASVRIERIGLVAYGTQ